MTVILKTGFLLGFSESIDRGTLYNVLPAADEPDKIIAQQMVIFIDSLLLLKTLLLFNSRFTGLLYGLANQSHRSSVDSLLAKKGQGHVFFFINFISSLKLVTTRGPCTARPRNM